MSKQKKKLETIFKEVENVTIDELKAIVNNETVFDADLNAHVLDKTTHELKQKDKVAVLVYNELNKSLTNKKQTLVLDCNFANSKMHNHVDASEDKYLVDYYCLVSNDDVNTRLMQFYVTVTKDNVYFHICTSCKKVTREQFAKLEESLQFKVSYNKKTNQAKTSERKKISYDEIVEVVKDVLAVLASEKTEK